MTLIVVNSDGSAEDYFLGRHFSPNLTRDQAVWRYLASKGALDRSVVYDLRPTSGLVFDSGPFLAPVALQQRASDVVSYVKRPIITPKASLFFSFLPY
jgi:hypothetical protein